MTKINRNHLKITKREHKQIDGETLGDLIEEFGPEWRIDIEVDCASPYYSSYYTSYLEFTRLETDEERDERIRKEEEYLETVKQMRAEQKKKKDESEKRLYQRLKKKYEKKDR